MNTSLIVTSTVSIVFWNAENSSIRRYI